jgi:phosphate transport system substrate-binding protein
MDVKKGVRFILRFVLTAGLVTMYSCIMHSLEYLSQLDAVDNIIGAAPLILLTGATGFLIALVWKCHKDAEISTIVIAVLSVIWVLLFIPSITGNWFPLAKMPAPDLTSPDLTVYTPFAEDTQTAELPGAASVTISEDLSTLDGATALYPVYAAFVNAVYDRENYTKDIALCTNTQNAYKRIIAGDCDIIFVAGASEKQKQAAKDAGVELVFTPIGREAFVFLAGKNNPIEGLSYQQLKNIYSGKTAYWRTLGWNEGGKIIAFQRPEGSGSQTGLQNIMHGLPIQKPQPLPDNSLTGTGSMMKQVSVKWHGVQPAIGYSYRYYATVMYPNSDAKILAIDGVYPSNETIANKSYPFTANFYAVTNGEPKGNMKTLIEWILSPQGQELVRKTGYTPVRY